MTVRTRIVCPAWCEIDHDERANWRAEADLQMLDRYGVTFPDVTFPDANEIVDFHEFTPFREPRLTVSLIAPIYANGRTGTADVHVDSVDGPWDGFDADGCRQVAEALLAAADRLEATS